MREGCQFVDWKSTRISVIPAHAGIQAISCVNRIRTWMPAFAGMTNYHSHPDTSGFKHTRIRQFKEL